LEIRNLQRTEIMEVGEKFDPEKQVGSSTMPHKMNPITAERICGIARVIRSYVVAALENNPLWHERDLTNSSSERIILPEACILTDYILKLTLDVLCNLVFYPENIKRNLEFTGGLIMAERLMAELTRRCMGRQTAYAAVRQCAIEASRTGRSLRDVVLERSEIMDYLTVEDLEEIMNPETYIGSARRMVERVLEESEKWL
ncbi:MAG: adenylosuccinate lyase, partial [Methanothermobacter sp.]|nr:adenylosuccinate lyase [Methanothermobacter sp.]